MLQGIAGMAHDDFVGRLLAAATAKAA